MDQSKSLSVKVSSVWSVPASMHGQRADLYLRHRIKRISRERVKRIILGEDFLLDEQVIKPSSRVKAGQRATLKRFAPDAVTDIHDFVVKVIFEDEQLLVIDKPAGLSVHPSANCLYKTLTHWLRHHRPGFKINPCHRLDKETTGLLVSAKDRGAEARIKKAFMTGSVEKSYLAVVMGKVQSQCISLPLGLQKGRGLVAIRMVADTEGKPAKTRVRPLLYDERLDLSVVLCRPYTGRQHQIRAHLSLVGHPLLGDKLYAYGDDFFDNYCRNKGEYVETGLMSRHALHAVGLSFHHKAQRQRLRCPLPADMATIIHKMRHGADASLPSCDANLGAADA